MSATITAAGALNAVVVFSAMTAAAYLVSTDLALAVGITLVALFLGDVEHRLVVLNNHLGDRP